MYMYIRAAYRPCPAATCDGGPDCWHLEFDSQPVFEVLQQRIIKEPVEPLTCWANWSDTTEKFIVFSVFFGTNMAQKNEM